MKRVIIVTTLTALSGCATYSTVQSGPQIVKAITVTPTLAWNKVPSAVAFAGAPTWTADGLTLNALTFLSDIADGQPLVDSADRKEYPAFRKDMLPTEVIEIIESTMAKATKARVTLQGQLRPMTFGGSPGFQYEFEFVAADELPRKAFVAGAVKNDKLHAILYQAPRMYYYQSRESEVKTMVSSATIN